MTTLTIEQHKQAVKLGIAQREDGFWGFRKKCLNKKCDKILEDHCYASENFTEAVEEVKHRSQYSCSNECWAESGELYDWLCDQYDESDLAERGDCDEETVTRLKRRVKNGSTRNLPAKDKRVIERWIQIIQDDFSGEGEPDNYEVGCEI